MILMIHDCTVMFLSKQFHWKIRALHTKHRVLKLRFMHCTNSLTFIHSSSLLFFHNGIMQQREKDKERWRKRYYNMYSIFYKHTILNLSKKNGLWGVRARQTRPIGSPPFWTQPIFLHFSIVQNLVVLVVVRCNPTQHCYINFES